MLRSRCLTLAALVTTSLSLAACGGGGTHHAGAVTSAQASVSARSGGRLQVGGATLVVPARALSADARISARTAGAPPASASPAAGTPAPALALAATPVSFEIAGAQVTHPLSLTFSVPASVLPKAASPAGSADAVWLASYDPQAGTWQPVPSHYDRSARTVTAEVPHLSLWAPFTWDWRGIEVRLRESLSALGSGRASAPACPGVSGVTVTNDGGEDPPIIGCASQNGPDGLKVTITNNRAYVMVAQTPAGATLTLPSYTGFAEWLQSRDRIVAALGGEYLGATSMLTYTLPSHGDPVVFTAAPTWKTHVLDLAVVAADAVFNFGTAGYADCIMDNIARSDPAPLTDAPGLVVECFPGLAQASAFVRLAARVAKLMNFVQTILSGFDLVRDTLLGVHGAVHLTRPALPPPDLYISNGIELGALYQPSGYPAQIPLDNHDGITGLTWSVGSVSATGTGTLHEDNCVPDCAQGTDVTYPVQVTASDAKQCTVRIYQQSTDTFQQVPAYVFTTVTVRALSGSPPVLAKPGPLFGSVCR